MAFLRTDLPIAAASDSLPKMQQFTQQLADRATRQLQLQHISDGRRPVKQPTPGSSTVVHYPEQRQAGLWCHTCRADVTGRSEQHMQYGHSVTVEGV